MVLYMKGAVDTFNSVLLNINWTFFWGGGGGRKGCKVNQFLDVRVLNFEVTNIF